MSSTHRKRFLVKLPVVVVDIGCSCRRRRRSLFSSLTWTSLVKKSKPSVKLTPYPLSSSSSISTTAAPPINEEDNHKKVATNSKRVKKRVVVEESVAVVKESTEPYVDFRESMVQMIVEEELYAWDDLNHLLQRFLALNSPQHHHLILGAFADIWDRVFSPHE